MAEPDLGRHRGPLRSLQHQGAAVGRMLLVVVLVALVPLALYLITFRDRQASYWEDHFAKELGVLGISLGSQLDGLERVLAVLATDDQGLELDKEDEELAEEDETLKKVGQLRKDLDRPAKEIELHEGIEAAYESLQQERAALRGQLDQASRDLAAARIAKATAESRVAGDSILRRQERIDEATAGFEPGIRALAREVDRINGDLDRLETLESPLRARKKKLDDARRKLREEQESARTVGEYILKQLQDQIDESPIDRRLAGPYQQMVLSLQPLPLTGVCPSKGRFELTWVTGPAVRGLVCPHADLQGLPTGFAVEVVVPVADFLGGGNETFGFDTLVLVDGEGKRLAERSGAVPPIPSIAELLETGRGAGDGEERSGASALFSVPTTGSRRLVDHGGRSYLVFDQPIPTRLPGDDPLDWTLYGLVDSQRFTSLASAFALPTLANTVGVLLIALLLLPLIRLWLLGGAEGLSRLEAAALGLCLVLATSMATVLSLQWLVTDGAERRIEQFLKDAGDHIHEGFVEERDQALAFLDSANHAGLPRPDSDPFWSQGPPRWDLMVWTDLQGKVTEPRSNWDKGHGGIPPLGQRAYIQRVRDQRLWKTEPRNGKSFFIDRIRSWRTGRLQTAISIPRAGNGPAQEPGTQVLFKPLESFTESLVGPGAGLAVVERETGLVLYHSEDRLGLVESFTAETGGNRKLRGLVDEGGSGNVKGSYHGDDHLFRVRPIEGTDWSLVVFANLTYLQAIAFEALVLSAMLLGFGLVIPFLLVALVYQLLRGRHFAWLWPDEPAGRRYPAVVVLGGALIVLGLAGLGAPGPTIRWQWVLSTSIALGGTAAIILAIRAVATRGSGASGWRGWRLSLAAAALALAVAGALGMVSDSLGGLSSFLVLLGSLVGFAALVWIARADARGSGATPRTWRVAHTIMCSVAILVMGVLPGAAAYRESLALQLDRSSRFDAARTIRAAEEGAQRRRSLDVLYKNSPTMTTVKWIESASPRPGGTMSSLGFEIQSGGHEATTENGRFSPFTTWLDARLPPFDAASQALVGYLTEGDPPRSELIVGSGLKEQMDSTLASILYFLFGVPILLVPVYLANRLVALRLFAIDVAEVEPVRTPRPAIVHQSHREPYEWWLGRRGMKIKSTPLYSAADIDDVCGGNGVHHVLELDPNRALDEATWSALESCLTGTRSADFTLVLPDGPKLIESALAGPSVANHERRLDRLLGTGSPKSLYKLLVPHDARILEDLVQQTAARDCVVIDGVDPERLASAFVPNGATIVVPQLDAWLLQPEARVVLLSWLEQIVQENGAWAGQGRAIVVGSQHPPLGLLGEALEPDGAIRNGAEDAEQVRWARLLRQFAIVPVAAASPTPPAAKPSTALAESLDRLAEERRTAPELAHVHNAVRFEILGSPKGMAPGEVTARVAEYAEPVFRTLWAGCEPRERAALATIGAGRLPNARDEALVRGLLRRGLVRRAPEFRLASPAFEYFACRPDRQRRASRWRRESEPGAWRSLRTPLLAAGFAAAVMVSMAGGEAVRSTLALLSGAAAGLPALFDLMSRIQIGGWSRP